MSDQAVLEAALSYVEQGLPICLVRGKAPIGREWHKVVWDETRIRKAFAKFSGLGVGVLLGPDHGLIDVEIDGEKGDETFDKLFGAGPVPTATWQSSRGLHRLYRADDGVFEELEKRRAAVHLLKTEGDLEVRYGRRGAGLQSVLPPSGGRLWVRGPEEGFAEFPERSVFSQLLAGSGHTTEDARGSLSIRSSTLPGDIYNERATWESVLLPLGWTLVGERDGVKHWKRPGKTDKELSATTGFCETDNRPDCFYSFSDAREIHPFLPRQTFSKFEAYALINHDSDFTAASRDLAGQGYHESITVPFGELPTESPVPTVEAIDTGSLMFPGFVEQFATWHAERSPYRNYRAGAIGGIFLMSWLLGRRVRLSDNTRPNLSLLMLGPPGGGKTQMVDSIKIVLKRLGYTRSLVDAAASGAALEDALADDPCLMYVQEEAQALMRLISGGKDKFAETIATALKQIFSASKSYYHTRIKAKSKDSQVSHTIDQPHLSVLLTSPAEDFWTVLAKGGVHDGFSARLLPLELTQTGELTREVFENEDLLDEIVDRAAEWLNRPVPTVSFAVPDTTDNELLVATTEQLDPIIMHRTAAAESKAWDCCRDWNMLANTFAEKGHDVAAGYWRRGHEMVCKFELVMAGSAGALEISEDMTEKAIALTEEIINWKIKKGETFDTRTEERRMLEKRLMTTLRKHLCLSWREAYKKAHLRVEQLNMVLPDLLAEGTVHSDASLSLDGAQVRGKGTFISLPGHEPLDKGG